MMPNITLNVELLIKLMKLTNSNTDGEALAALRAANRALNASGGDWENLLRGKLAPIDPFASLPKPKPQETARPAAQPSRPYTPSPPPYTPPKSPPPPPPPTWHGYNKQEAKDINAWIVTLEYAPLGPKTQTEYTLIAGRWQRAKRLSKADYDFLRTTYTTIKAKGVTP